MFRESAEKALETFRDSKLDDQKFYAELIAQGWNPSDNKTMTPHHIKDAKAVLFFKFLAAINPFYLFPNDHFNLKDYVSILETYAEDLVSRETIFLNVYSKFLKYVTVIDKKKCKLFNW